MCGVAMLAICSGAAQAQNTTPTSVDEVVVTAQKRAERLEDVPISITVASGESIERAGISRMEDLARIAPAVQVSSNGIYAQPVIRGISSTLVGAAAENNVAIYVDGVYMPFQRGLNMDVANIRQIQVLKGPQGTLFGRNATGGAILIETLQPSMSERSGRFAVSYGRFDDKRVQGYFSTPLSDILAMNVTGYYRKSDGYIKDVAGFDSAPIENYNVNIQFRLEPSDRLTLTPSVYTSRISDARSLANTLEGYTLAAILAPTTPFVLNRRNRTSLTHKPVNWTILNSVQLKAEYDLGWANFTSQSYFGKEHSFSHLEFDGTPAQVFDIFFHEYGRSLTQEVNLTSTGEGPLSYVLGAFYFDSRTRSEDSFSRTGAVGPYLPNQNALWNTKAYAAYADFTWRAMDRLYLTGGIRYSHEKKDGMVWAGNGGALLAAPQASFNSTTPRVVVRYELADSTNVYASWTKGFKSGVLSSAPPYNIVDPEKITAYEVGFKTVGERFRFEAAAYYYDYTDMQVQTIISVTNAQGATSLFGVPSNAAAAEVYGAEAQLSLEVTERLGVSANVAYTHARFTDFRNASINGLNATRTLNVSSCPNPAPPPATAPCTADLTGQRLPRSPDWTANLSADYTIPVSVGKIVLSGNLSYSSSYAPTRSDLGVNGTGYRYDQGDILLLTLRGAWTSPDEHWTVSVYGNNITDERYYLLRTGNFVGDYHVEAEPATWGVRLDYRF
jgi:iron complex outermembrane receptor protein